MWRATAALALLVALAAVPAHAVVGGKRIAVSAVPWFASLPGCGGTLVTPDRVVTAGHCVRGVSPEEIAEIRVGGVVRKGIRFAMHPDWAITNGGNVLDDVAIIQLDQPVPNVAPVPLGGEARRMTVLGRGASRHNLTGAGTLREVTLKTVGDAACRRIYRRARGNDGERFSGPRMICSLDVNGRPPLSSACVGDSGGPLYTGSHAQPVLVGIVSFGGDRCGADRLPSVFTQVGRYRDFILNPAPVWAPVATGPAAITGEARRGGTLSCAVPGWETPPREVETFWLRGGRVVGDEATYRVRRADTGRTLTCAVLALGPGGAAIAPLAKVPVSA